MSQKRERKQAPDMKKYLVDTTVLVDHLRGKKTATKFLGGDGLVISFVGLAELVQGSRNKKDQKAVEELVEDFEINWGSAGINHLAVKLLAKYFLKHNLRFLDALVAAIALEKDLILVTDNIKHFKFISGLKVVLPGEAR